MTVDDDDRPSPDGSPNCGSERGDARDHHGFADAPDTSIACAPASARSTVANGRFQRVHDEDHVQHAGKILAVVGS
jgi:hypothetical protein